MLFVDAAHERGGGWQDLVDEDEDGLLGRQLDALADDVDKLADGEVCRYQVLLLVDGRDVALLDLLADDLSKVTCQRPPGAGRGLIVWPVGEGTNRL